MGFRNWMGPVRTMERESAFAWLASQIGGVSVSQALDVGVGEGIGMRLAARHWPGARVRGVEWLPDRVVELRAKGYEIVRGSAEWLEFPDGIFDLVTCLHTLEHCEHPDWALVEMWRVLKPGGRLFVVVPREKVPTAKMHHLSCFPRERAVQTAAKEAKFENIIVKTAVVQRWISREIWMVASKI